MFSLTMTLIVTVATLAPPPATLRVAILDRSSSMQELEQGSGKPMRRIDIAKAELRQLAQQLPPSPEHPLGIVLFSSTATSHVFQDLPGFEKFLDGIEPSGGTSISLGLQGAREILEQGDKATAMFVLLFTDGENTEPDGPNKVAVQEAALDRLFASRNERGLATNVIVKRWANANSELVSRWAARPNWKVHDVRDFQIATATAVPRVTVQRVDWIDKDRLQVKLSGQVEVRGAFPLSTSGLSLRCVNAEATGQTNVTLPVIPQAAVEFAIALEARQLSAKPASGQLIFTLPAVSPKLVGKEFVLPSAPTEFRVAFDVPPRPRRFAIQAVLKPQKSRWSDPVQREVITDVLLHLTIQATDGLSLSWPTPVHFLVEPAPGVLLASGSRVVEVRKEGEHVVPLSLSSILPEHVLSGKLLVHLTPQDAPGYMTFQPGVVPASEVFSAPGPVITTVTITSQDMAHGRWTDLGGELAAFAWTVTATVRGPTTSSRFTVVAPPTVSDLDIEPSILRTGEQTLQLRLIARCTARKPSTLQLELIPPPPTESIQYQVTQPIRVSMMGPDPAQLVLLDRGQVLSEFPIAMAETTDAYESSLSLGLLDVPDTASMVGVRANLSATANLPFTIDPLAHVGHPFAYRLRLPSDHQQNFFVDSEYMVTVEVLPDPPVSSLVGSIVILNVVVPAPFKRWLFGLLVSGGILVIVVGPIALLWRHQSSGEKHDPSPPSEVWQPSTLAAISNVRPAR